MMSLNQKEEETTDICSASSIPANFKFFFKPVNVAVLKALEKLKNCLCFFFLNVVYIF